MKFTADLHVHSKYSRATARNLDLENLYISAQMKGLTVIGTGDFTHPGWWNEIKEKLQPAEEGLFALKKEFAHACDKQVPASCRHPIRFILSTEISNIYKKEGRTRKNHNLVFLPGIEKAEKFNRILEKVGNIASDGRPILGLDARKLLKILLETCVDGYLIPAHIWTPWFSLLGSKSGFDSVDECFEDLASYIFALETGLSSDPAMNWRISGLDRFTLVSNSDAHSPGRLGREANCFDTELSYTAIRRALAGVDAGAFQGTLEFFPEEGKYHTDGHSACGFSCQPVQTRAMQQLCPVCAKPLVVGVLYRVEELADRPEGAQPGTAKPFRSLIPLEEILAEIYQCGPNSQRVRQSHACLLNRYGPEIDILRHLPCDELDLSGVPLLGVAIERMRRGAVSFEPGYDGVYGKVRIFRDQEREELAGQEPLFAQFKAGWVRAALSNPAAPPNSAPEPRTIHPQEITKFCLNAEQQKVIDHIQGPLMIQAGPGSGKTRTITARIANLIRERQVRTDQIAAVTFTRKAAREMLDRLRDDCPSLPIVSTFHGFCRTLLLRQKGGTAPAIVNDDRRALIMADAMRLAGADKDDLGLAQALSAVMKAKQLLLRPADDLHRVLKTEGDYQPLARIYEAYQHLLKLQGLFDFEDLIAETVRGLESDASWRSQVQGRITHLFVDEFQDINYSQYRLVRLLAPGNSDLCVIGDPDQSIYGFRGSEVRFFDDFLRDYPTARQLSLTCNYRSTQTILRAAYQVLQAGPKNQPDRKQTVSDLHGEPFISILQSPSARAECAAIGRIIEQMVGGTGFQAIDFGKVESAKEESGFRDFAVLYRTHEQGELFAEMFGQAGIPFQKVCRKTFGSKAGVLKLMALLRILIEQGGYVDLIFLRDLAVPSISRETLNLFKDWAYSAELTLPDALRAVLRVPIPTLSLARQQRLSGLVKSIRALKTECAGCAVSQVIETCLAKTTLQSQIDARELEALLLSAGAYDRDLASFVADQDLQSDTDLYSDQAEKVALMTLHASKGLEFDFVFMAGCEQGLIPYHFSSEAHDPEEERRLFFVGLTRARKRLFLSWARKRNLFGKVSLQKPSPYLDHIEQVLKKDLDSCRGRQKERQLSLF